MLNAQVQHFVKIMVHKKCMFKYERVFERISVLGIASLEEHEKLSKETCPNPNFNVKRSGTTCRENYGA